MPDTPLRKQLIYDDVQESYDQGENAFRRIINDFLQTLFSLGLFAQILVLLRQNNLFEIKTLLAAEANKFANTLSEISESQTLRAALIAAKDIRELNKDFFLNTNHLRIKQLLSSSKLDRIRSITQIQQELTQRVLSDIDIWGENIKVTAGKLADSFGLTPAQWEHVENYEYLLRTNQAQSLQRSLRDHRSDSRIQRFIREGRPLDDKTVQRLVSRYTQNYRRLRIRAIIQTETLAAVNEGISATYDQAISEGIIDGSTLTAEWQTRRDARVRSSHQHMQGQRRGHNETFTSGLGNALRWPGDRRAPGIDVINCRCVLIRDYR